MRKTIEFLFDYGSPNAYLVHRVLPGFVARTGAEVTAVPVLLGGLFKLANNRSPMLAYAEIPHKLAYERLEMKRFIERHGLGGRFRFNPHFPVNTLQVMRGAVAARRLGCAEAYDEAMFAAMWEQGRKLDDPAEAAAAMTAAGLDAAAIAEASQTPEVKAALLAATEQAHARGAFGAPSFFVDGELWFGKERLRDIEERWAGGVDR